MKIYQIIFSIFLLGTFVGESKAQYTFVDDIRLDCTEIKSQGKTGTCWCFSAISMLESELLSRNVEVDLSEMYLVRQVYLDKARNYILRQGKAQFSQGSLAHDVLKAMDRSGLMPDYAYPGLLDSDSYDHNELEKELTTLMQNTIKKDTLDGDWLIEANSILDKYMGVVPEYFEWDGREFNALSFAMEMGLSSEQFVHLTSFTHHDFYSDFILEIPDNYSNGSFYNVPMDRLVEAVDRSLAMGHTVAWDGDVSEPGFSARHGLAILPKGEYNENMFDAPVSEIKSTQALRQKLFESYVTTDDHLMQIIGSAKDQNGTKYYIIKNSWGEIGSYKGLLYMSEEYFKLKTVALTFPIQVAKLWPK